MPSIPKPSKFQVPKASTLPVPKLEALSSAKSQVKAPAVDADRVIEAITRFTKAFNTLPKGGPAQIAHWLISMKLYEKNEEWHRKMKERNGIRYINWKNCREWKSKNIRGRDELPYPAFCRTCEQDIPLKPGESLEEHMARAKGIERVGIVTPIVAGVVLSYGAKGPSRGDVCLKKSLSGCMSFFSCGRCCGLFKKKKNDDLDMDPRKEGELRMALNEFNRDVAEEVPRPVERQGTNVGTAGARVGFGPLKRQVTDLGAARTTAGFGPVKGHGTGGSTMSTTKIKAGYSADATGTTKNATGIYDPIFSPDAAPLARTATFPSMATVTSLASNTRTVAPTQSKARYREGARVNGPKGMAKAVVKQAATSGAEQANRYVQRQVEQKVFAAKTGQNGYGRK